MPIAVSIDEAGTQHYHHTPALASPSSTSRHNRNGNAEYIFYGDLDKGQQLQFQASVYSKLLLVRLLDSQQGGWIWAPVVGTDDKSGCVLAHILSKYHLRRCSQQPLTTTTFRSDTAQMRQELVVCAWSFCFCSKSITASLATKGKCDNVVSFHCYCKAMPLAWVLATMYVDAQPPHLRTLTSRPSLVADGRRTHVSYTSPDLKII